MVREKVGLERMGFRFIPDPWIGCTGSIGGPAMIIGPRLVDGRGVTGIGPEATGARPVGGRGVTPGLFTFRPGTTKPSVSAGCLDRSAGNRPEATGARPVGGRGATPGLFTYRPGTTKTSASV